MQCDARKVIGERGTLANVTLPKNLVNSKLTVVTTKRRHSASRMGFDMHGTTSVSKVIKVRLLSILIDTKDCIPYNLCASER